MTRYAKIADGFYAAGQIAPEDLPEIARMGVTTVINNRPDGEGGPDQPSSGEMAAAAAAAGLRYHYIPMTPATLGPELLEDFRRAMEGADGPVLAHCRSGARSTALWAMTEASHKGADVDAVLSRAREAGFDLSGMRPAIEHYASQEAQRRD